MPRAGIAFGSNVGDRLATLQHALDALIPHASPGHPVLAAPIYRSAPVLCPDDSPDFFNTAVEIHFSGTPEKLLEITSGIEQQLGRHRSGIRNAPRTIDLDLLYVGELRCQSDLLTLPHPRLAQRRFVLQPLCDIRPDWIPPGSDLPVRALLEQLDDGLPPLEIVASFDSATLGWQGNFT